MKIECWKCKGKGWIYDHEDALFTCGLSYIFQILDGKDGYNIICPICNGKGYQENEED